jgi:GT2 family glycosyltransferase
MKHRAALRTEVDIRPAGEVVITLRGAGAPLVAELGVVVDGLLRAAVAPVAGGATQRRFTWQLPGNVVHSALELLALPGGDRLLVTPLDLSAAYDITLAPLVADGVYVSGGFSGGACLAGTLGVELLEGGQIAGRGVATRGADGAFSFRVAIATLIPPGRIANLTARIAGVVPQQAPLVLTPGELGYAGCLDSAGPGAVEGWAVDLRRPKQRVAIEVLLGTEVVAEALAQDLREDIRHGGIGDGRCGFTALLPKQTDPTAVLRIAVRIAATQTELSGSPLIIEPMPQLLGRFDTLHGMSAHGWALDVAHPNRKVVVEALGPKGEFLGSAVANNFRGDLLGAGLADGLCAFKIDLSEHFERLIGQDITLRYAGTRALLQGSPQRIMPNGNLQRFLRRRDVLAARPGVLPRLKRALTHRAGSLGISIIMPVYNTPRAWLLEALESVRHQFCDNWELLCIDDGSTAPHVKTLLESYALADKRVRVLSSPQNVGITRAVNFCLRAARHDYVTFLDHDDYLEPDAIWQLIRAVQITGADFLYGDEALTDENLKGILELRLRPAFSHDYYLSHPYFVHPICVRTALARQIGGWDETMPISADVDFVLRVIEHARSVAHVPAVLYRWRTHETSTGHAKQASVMAATIGALQRHLDRLGLPARVSEGPWFNQFRLDWPDDNGLILIVIPTKNGHVFLRKAVESIERTAAGAAYRLVVIDHESDEPETRAYLDAIASRHVVMPYTGVFNFSRMNNLAVKKHGSDAEFVLFLNNDVEATQDGWLGRLRSLAARSDVGAVGALLMYVDQRVQHAGVVLGFNNSADHALRLQDVWLDKAGRRNLGYNCALSSVRDYSAVTAACIMMRREVFDAVHGFEEKFGIGFNDTDLCLRIRKAGLKILYDGYTILYHYESATRSQTKQVFHPEDTRRMTRRWGKLLKQGDPFYNPNLSLRTQDHVLTEDPGCRITHAPRVTVLRA